MASRDYKNAGRFRNKETAPSRHGPAVTPRARSKESSSKKSVASGLVIGLLLGVTVAVGVAFFLSRSPDPFQQPVQPAPRVKVPDSAAVLAPGVGPDTVAPSVNQQQTTVLPTPTPEPPPVPVGQPEPVAPPVATPAAPVVAAKVAEPPPAEPAAPKATPPAEKPAAAEPNKGPNYEFYKILPGLAEPVPSGEPNASERTKPAAERKTYLQIGAFSKSEEADNLKARLALSGIEVKIQSADTEKGLIHRVRVGPFTKQGEIDQAMATLREAGLSATVVREPVNKAQ